MTSTVIGNGPLTFTDSSGRQISIPLSVLTFDSSGSLVVDKKKWTPPANEESLITNLLNYLVTNQLVTPISSASPKPAMVVNAAIPGAAGNHILIKIDYKPTKLDPDPTKVTFDVTVTQKDIYSGLKTSTVIDVLGSNKPKAEKQFGLVRVVDGSIADPNLLPDDSKPFELKLPASPPPNSASVDITDKASKKVFTLEASQPGKDGELITVSFSDVKVTEKTFTLTAQWQKQITGVSIGNVQQKFADLSYLVTVALPPSGIFSIPADDSTSLSGGADGQTPSSASATIFTKPS